MNTTTGGSCFDPSASSSLYYSQAALSGLGGSHGSLQDPVHMRSNMLYSNCSGGLPNIILTGKSGFSFFWSLRKILTGHKQRDAFTCLSRRGDWAGVNQSMLDLLSGSKNVYLFSKLLDLKDWVWPLGFWFKSVICLEWNFPSWCNCDQSYERIIWAPSENHPLTTIC